LGWNERQVPEAKKTYLPVDEEEEDDEVLDVTTPMANPPTAPARIPINASTRVLSTKLAFPRLAINPPENAYILPRFQPLANCRRALIPIK
jgi:hypothetical protein